MGLLDPPALTRQQADARYPVAVFSPRNEFFGYRNPTTGRVRAVRNQTSFLPRHLAALAAGNSLVIGTNAPNLQACISQFMHLSQGRFSDFGNIAVGGRKSSDVLAGLPAEYKAGTECLVYMEGTNDAAGVTPVTPTQHITNMDAIAQYAMSRGAYAIVHAPPPFSSAYASTANALVQEKYVFWQRIWAEKVGAIWLDPWVSCLNPDGSGTIIPAYDTNPDGVHFPEVMHNVGAIEALDQLTTGRMPPLLPRSNKNGPGMFNGNAWLLTEKSGSPGFPDNWFQSGWGAGMTSALSAQALPIRGNACTITVASFTGTGITFHAVGAPPSAYYTPGDEVRMCGYFKQTATSNFRGSCRVLANAPGGNTSIYAFDASNRSFDWTYFDIPIKVPSDATNVQVFIENKSASGSGAHSGSISFANVDLYNVTQATVAGLS